MLRAVPANEIERTVGVDPWFAQNAVAFDCGNLLIGPHILQKTWDHLSTKTGVAFEELGSVDLPKTKAEAHEIIEAPGPSVRVLAPPDKNPHGVHDCGGVPKPMEEIVRIAARRAGQHRSLYGPHRRSKPRPLLNKRRRGNALRQLRRTMPELFFGPNCKRRVRSHLHLL